MVWPPDSGSVADACAVAFRVDSQLDEFQTDEHLA